MHFYKRLVQSELISKILTISELWDILYIEVDGFYERSAVARGTLASISILFVSEIFALGQMWNNFLRKLWNRKLTLSVKWNKSSHAARRISHCGAIFHARRVFHKSWKDLFHWKNRQSCIKIDGFFWWERVDSNHRRRSQQIYSLPPLATRELSLELVMGLEPATCWLQISCSPNWATPANIQ